MSIIKEDGPHFVTDVSTIASETFCVRTKENPPFFFDKQRYGQSFLTCVAQNSDQPIHLYFLESVDGEEIGMKVQLSSGEHTFLLPRRL